jgi:hypothetical protein
MYLPQNLEESGREIKGTFEVCFPFWGNLSGGIKASKSVVSDLLQHQG